jgi:hypothetical protein
MFSPATLDVRAAVLSAYQQRDSILSRESYQAASHQHQTAMRQVLSDLKTLEHRIARRLDGVQATPALTPPPVSSPPPSTDQKRARHRRKHRLPPDDAPFSDRRSRRVPPPTASAAPQQALPPSSSPQAASVRSPHTFLEDASIASPSVTHSVPIHMAVVSSSPDRSGLLQVSASPVSLSTRRNVLVTARVERVFAEGIRPNISDQEIAGACLDSLHDVEDIEERRQEALVRILSGGPERRDTDPSRWASVLVSIAHLLLTRLRNRLVGSTGTE